MSEAPSWQHMWGAKVKMPCDMEDDVLEDAIKSVTTRLGNYDTEEWEKKGLAVCEEIKAHLDATWDPHWVVCIGRNFGSFVTHVTRNFIFFYYNEKAEKNTIKAEKFKSDGESRFVAYLCLIKNEDVDLAADVFCLLAKGSMEPECQSWMKKTVGYLPRARDYSVPELTEIALVSMVLTDYGIGNLNELYSNGQLKHYKNIPLNSLQIRSTSQQKSYKDQSRSTQKDVAHLGGLDLITAEHGARAAIPH